MSNQEKYNEAGFETPPKKLTAKEKVGKGIEGTKKVGRVYKGTVNSVRTALQGSRMAIRAAEAVLIASLFYKLPEAKEGVEFIKSFPLEYLNMVLEYTNLFIESGWDLLTNESPMNQGGEAFVNTVKHLSVDKVEVGKGLIAVASLEVSRKILSYSSSILRVLYPMGNTVDRIPGPIKKVVM